MKSGALGHETLGSCDLKWLEKRYFDLNAEVGRLSLSLPLFLPTFLLCCRSCWPHWFHYIPLLPPEWNQRVLAPWAPCFLLNRLRCQRITMARFRAATTPGWWSFLDFTAVPCDAPFRSAHSVSRKRMCQGGSPVLVLLYLEFAACRSCSWIMFLDFRSYIYNHIIFKIDINGDNMFRIFLVI